MLRAGSRALAIVLVLASGLGGCQHLTADQEVQIANAAATIATAIIQAAKQ